MQKSFYFTCNTIVAIVVILLGIIHNIATFTPIIETGFECVSAENHMTLVFFSLGTGSATLMSGLMLILLGKALQVGAKKIRGAMYLTVFFLLFIAGVAVVCGTKNPFAYIMLLLAVLEIIIVFNLRENAVKQ
jgi:hypothetical protein